MKRSICLSLCPALLFSVFFLYGCMTIPGTCAPDTQVPPVSHTHSFTAPAVKPSAEPITEPPATAPPAAPSTASPAEPPVTESIGGPNEYIGSLYTRGQLATISNEMLSFGSGRYYSDRRPADCLRAQKENSGYNAVFIGEDTPTVYLTFDCGYEYENLTGKILDILKEKHIKAVFFVTMHYCKTQPGLVQRMIDEGHIVGNHSSNHPQMPALSADDMAYEIMSLHEYVKNSFDYEMTLFRPPGGYYSTRTLALAQSLGYRSVFWSFAYRDWETAAQPDPEEALYTVTSCAHNGCIYLLHAVSATNAAILPDIIDDLQNRGYSLALYQ